MSDINHAQDQDWAIRKPGRVTDLEQDFFTVGCSMTSNPELGTNRWGLITIRWIAMLALAWSGGIHLYILPVQFSHSIAHGSFFLLLGLAQIGWALAFWKFRARAWSFIGLGLSGGMVILWALTQLLHVPYAQSAEPVDLLAIMSKMAEINAFVALVGYLIVSTRDDLKESSIPWTVAGAVTLAIGFGITVWGAGRFAEVAAPDFGRGVHSEGASPHSHSEQPALHGGPGHQDSSNHSHADTHGDQL